MRMIDVDKLKQYIDDCECCEKCDQKGFMCNDHCELPDCVTPQWERLLNEQPTVDAVPVSYIQQRIDRLRVLAEYEAEANGGYIGRSSMALFELEELIKYWKAEREQK